MQKFQFRLCRTRLTVAILAALALAGTASSLQAQQFPPVTNLTSLNGSNGFRLNGDQANDKAGESVSAAGDINGDGLDDLIVCSKDASPTGSLRAGACYVVYGKTSAFAHTINLSSLNGGTGFRIDGAAEGENSGNSVRAAGDVNGDGRDDLIIGAPGAPGAGPDGNVKSGSSYVVFGNASAFQATIGLINLDGSNGFRLDGDLNFDRSGFSVSGAGDINGDGVDDLIVGVSAIGPNRTGLPGKSYVVFGKTSAFAATINLGSLNGSDGFRLNGAVAGDLAGRTVSAAGDINGDGVDDLIVGAPGAGPDGNAYSGSSYVVFGKTSAFAASFDLANLDGGNGFRLDGTVVNEYSGFSVSAAGDINGDGLDDLIVGAHPASPNGLRSGSSFVVFGKTSAFTSTIKLSSLNGSNGFRLDGALAGDYSGFSVGAAGDLNGDGLDDLIVGARGTDFNGSLSGSSYIVFGKTSAFPATIGLASIDGSNGFRLDGALAGDTAGASVSAAGDINDDGFDDLLIGAPFADPNGISNSGSSYLVFGRDTGLVFKDGFE